MSNPSRYESLYTPAAIFLGAVAIALSIFFTGGLGGGTPSGLAGTENPGEAGGPVTVSIDDDPILGDPNAPVTIVEFSDFQCPFCRSFWSETLPRIKSEYIDQGLVRLVYRDLPLTSIGHEMAQPYAEAAHCAGDQGKFWEMHDKIFAEQEKQGTGTISGITIADVKSWAREIGLDGGSFDSCLDGGQYADEVAADVVDAQNYGANGTPSFYVGLTDPSGSFVGTYINGAQPFESFQQVIDGFLNE